MSIEPTGEELEAAMRGFSIYEQRGLREAMAKALAAAAAVRRENDPNWHEIQAATAEACECPEAAEFHASKAKMLRRNATR